LEAQTASAAARPEPGLSLQESSASLLANSLLGLLQTGQTESAAEPLALSGASGVDAEVEYVLNMLDDYIKALGDPQKTLKDIAPLADDLDRGATRLDQLASTLEEGDPLKGLTNDTAALAAVEALKFRRGDLI
jgi:predicted metal-dependent hydrolase